jgi:hypothetical protein
MLAEDSSDRKIKIGQKGREMNDCKDMITGRLTTQVCKNVKL